MSEVIREILDNKNINFEYVGMGFMSEFDTQKMRHYILTINGKKFDYFEGLGHEELTDNNEEEKIVGALSCLVKEYSCLDYCNSIDSFMAEYGYEDLEQAKYIFKEIKANNKKLEKVLTTDEIAILQDETFDL